MLITIYLNLFYESERLSVKEEDYFLLLTRLKSERYPTTLIYIITCLSRIVSRTMSPPHVIPNRSEWLMNVIDDLPNILLLIPKRHSEGATFRVEVMNHKYPIPCLMSSRDKETKE